MAIRKLKSAKYGYVYQVDIRYKDADGITQRHSKSGFRTKSEAKKYEASIIDKAAKNKLIEKPDGRTINDVFYEYMKVEGNLKYAPSTKVYYTKTFRAYIEDNIGKTSIHLADYSVLQKYINDSSAIHNYPTLRNMKKCLAVTFKYAIRAGYISNNPVPYIILPGKSPTKETATISDEDLDKIIQELINRHVKRRLPEKTKFAYKSYAVALHIGRYTGLRISEVLALKKEDFDLDNHRLAVCRRVEWAGLKSDEIYLRDQLKTKNSKNTVEISIKLCNDLKRWFKHNPHELVICRMDGSLIYPQTFEDAVHKIARKKGFDFHYHMLRHTFATELMMADVNPIVVRDLMRHSEVNTTWNVYTHSNMEKQQEVLDDLYEDDTTLLEIDLSDIKLEMK